MEIFPFLKKLCHYDHVFYLTETVWWLSFYLTDFVCVYIYIRVWVPYTACLWRLEDNFEELGLAFHHLKQSLLFLPQAVYSSLEGPRASG